MRLAAFSAVLALAACQPAEKLSESEKLGQDEPGAPMELAPDPTPVTFTAMSKTAEAFTGDIGLSAQPRPGPNATPRMKITTATGIVYETELLPGGAEQATAIDWKALFGQDVVVAANPPPGAPSIDMHLVSLETVPPGAPNGGFCGDEKTFAIAMATGLSNPGGKFMSISAFKGDQWPPKDDSVLCGTFNYIPPA
jgi:hypothetical protein